MINRKTNCIAIIPARGGSKRIPRKNIKNFFGKPLIAYSIEVALESKLFDKVIVSTEDEEIASIAKKYGAEVPFIRPKELSDDFIGTDDVVQHSIEYLKKQGYSYQFICTIYATAPLLQKKYLKEGLSKLKSSNAKQSFSVTSMPFPIQRTFKLNSNGRCQMFTPEHYDSRSQDLEEAYQDAGQFYWENTQIISDEIPFGEDSIPIILPRHLVQDIDTEEDWKRTEYMYQSLKKMEKSQEKTISILTEAGKLFGFGHLTRCLSIASEFKKFNYSVNFIVNGDKSILKVLNDDDVVIFNWQKNSKKLLPLLNTSLILIDSIEITNKQIEKIEHLNIPIILIDDYKRRNILNQGFIVDWTILIEEKNYFFPKKQNVNYFLGSNYTPLREEFYFANTNKINKEINSILVSFGGSDIHNLTPHILRLLNSTHPNIMKNIVIGSGFTNISEIKELKKNNVNLIFNANAKTMVKLMQQCDLAISAGGQTLYELSRIGIPTIAILIVDNAIDDTSGWDEVGSIINIGWWNDLNLTKNLINAMNKIDNYNTRKLMQQNGQKYVIPNSGNYLVKKILDFL